MEKKGETERERESQKYRNVQGDERDKQKKTTREDRGEEEGKPKGKEARRGCGRRRGDWGSGQGETKERKRGTTVRADWRTMHTFMDAPLPALPRPCVTH